MCNFKLAHASAVALLYIVQFIETTNAAFPYVLGTENTDICPDGSSSITDFDECKRSAVNLDIGFDNRRSLSRSSYPTGCVRTISDTGYQAFFNDHASGSSSSWAWKICKSRRRCPPGEHLTHLRRGGSACVPIGSSGGRPFMVDGISRTTTSETCNIDNRTHTASWKMGQAPSIPANNPHNQEIGRRWLQSAEAEHASVASFARHTLQLMSIGAPSELLIASQSASLDEIKHAKMSYGIASAFLGSDFGPGTIDVNDGLASMDLEDIIQSVIQEGCIEETLSAMEVHWAAHNAQDGTIKSTLLEIASDETNHAQLAWDTINWSIEKYPETRPFVEESFRAALTIVYGKENNDFILPPKALGADSEKDVSFRKYGILASGDREKLRKVGIRDIIAPVYLGGFMDVTSISKQIIKLSVSIP